MKCPNCGNEVDTSICVACPNCKTKMPNVNPDVKEIGMQDDYGNTMTVGGNLAKPRKKVNLKVVIPLIVVIVLIFVGVYIYQGNKPRTHEESIVLAREHAEEVINKQLKWKNLNTWYANNCIDDNGDDKFIIYCDVYGELITGAYGRIQMYVGIQLKKGNDYIYWTTDNIYPHGDSTPNPYEPAYSYVQQLKNSMGW